MVVIVYDTESWFMVRKLSDDAPWRSDIKPQVQVSNDGKPAWATYMFLDSPSWTTWWDPVSKKEGEEEEEGKRKKEEEEKEKGEEDVLS